MLMGVFYEQKVNFVLSQKQFWDADKNYLKGAE